MLDTITKAPADRLDYDFDFSRWMPSGDRITAADAAIAPEGVTVERIETSETVARIWLSGGEANTSAVLTVTITTLAGRTKEVSAGLRIKDAR